jgi:hypothetical protein
VGAFDTLELLRLQPSGQTITENRGLKWILPGLAPTPRCSPACCRQVTTNALMCAMPVPGPMPACRRSAVGEFSTLLRQPLGTSKLVPIDTGDLPPGNRLGVSLVQHGLFGIRHSSDQGKTWRPEYSNVDRAA